MTASSQKNMRTNPSAARRALLAYLLLCGAKATNDDAGIATAIRHATGLEVVAADAGAALNAKNCKTPSLWIFLGGMYRTFDWTQRRFAAVARASVGECYHVAAVMPVEVDSPATRKPWARQGWKHFDAARDVSSRPDAVAQRLRRASDEVFSGRLAFAVVDRGDGPEARWPGCFTSYWIGEWVVAKTTTHHHGWAVDRHAVVLRTRPDVALDPVGFDLFKARAFFASLYPGHDAHVVFGQQRQGSQGDVHVTTSFGTYEADVAAPLVRRPRASNLPASLRTSPTA